MNKKIVISMLLLIITCLFVTACSEDESVEQKEPSNTENSDTETSEDKSTTMETEEDTNTEEEDSSDEFIENQSGLKIGETGTIVNADDESRYEVTLNEVRYEEIENVKLFGEVFAVVDVTIKNIDDKTINSEDIFYPSIGELDTNEYTGPVGFEFVQDIPGIDVIEGEIEPGESVTVNYVFDINKADNYHFAFGTTWDNIITRAEWELSEDEVK
ncbi:hypothetical protein CIL05_13390 [Virgibacillus profundi]|uniref:DUF4352 domain-containing protein n=1 Tax=Virgibacillus profundi TaxID=2024555 RepID=A0A2A2IB69_9BACI|nr:DUF4352 domain-containing protein [Virgibacillus profundi]PAV28969.1 hypothetical protein CIL05_13390 [Virgibacillus profundi]PXY53137.1 DUF4352 domain-containing protein [Virgibacillus profundi]